MPEDIVAGDTIVDEGTIVVGDTIVAYCAKCRLSLAHTIVTLDGARTTRVTCSTCSSTHPFKHPDEAPKPRTPRAKKAEVAAASIAALWESRVATAKGKEHVYTMGTKYGIGDIVLHEQFGKGVVLKLLTNKCHVLFQDKERLMASGN